MSVGLVALFALFLLGVLGIAVVAALIAAIRHGRWGVLLVLGGVVALPMLFILLMVATFQVRPTATASVPTLTSDAPRHVQHTVEATDEEFVTTNQYTEVISDKPPIQLDDEEATDEETASDDTTAEAEPEAVAVETNADLPDWIDARAKPHDKIFTSGPFVTPTQCEEDTRQQILAWLAEKAGVNPPVESLPGVEATLDEVVRRTHLGKRETSVGTVYLQYTRAHSDAGVVQNIRNISNRQSGLNRLVIGGGLLLGLVGIIHGVLRSKPSSPTSKA